MAAGVHVVLKLSKLCNLRCTYCYEFDELSLRDRMPLSGLEHFFESFAAWWKPSRGKQVTFVFHGGEPLLLPEEYLRAVIAAQRRILDPVGVAHRSSIQTNLTTLNRKRIDLLDELGVSLGLSLDVFGGQRRSLNGVDAQPRVLDNLQLLIDTGALERLKVGAIAVLHSRNVGFVLQIHEFYRRLGISYRLLPVFSLTDVPARMNDLPLTAAEVVDAYQSIVVSQFRRGSNGITVYPLYNFFSAAVARIREVRVAPYDPAHGEWALIVNTNGDVYNHSEAYTGHGLLGNIFADSFADVMEGDRRRAMIDLRRERNITCERCPYGFHCSRLPIVEALPSERALGLDGTYECLIARPMIAFMENKLRADPELMREALRPRGSITPSCPVV